jgi:hypothetical protein
MDLRWLGLSILGALAAAPGCQRATPSAAAVASSGAAAPAPAQDPQLVATYRRCSLVPDCADLVHLCPGDAGSVNCPTPWINGQHLQGRCQLSCALPCVALRPATRGALKARPRDRGRSRHRPDGRCACTARWTLRRAGRCEALNAISRALARGFAARFRRPAAPQRSIRRRPRALRTPRRRSRVRFAPCGPRGTNFAPNSGLVAENWSTSVEIAASRPASRQFHAKSPPRGPRGPSLARNRGPAAREARVWREIAASRPASREFGAKPPPRASTEPFCVAA